MLISTRKCGKNSIFTGGMRDKKKRGESGLLRVRSFRMIWIRISDPRSLCVKGTDESMTRVDSSVPVGLMHHDPDRSWITDPDPDHPKGTHPK